jgi:hypothetical protein
MESASGVPTRENMENIKNIILRQTDYTEEEVIEKLKEHNNNPMAVIREYMSTPSPSSSASERTSVSAPSTAPSPAPSRAKSVNQQIYGEIRGLMDTAAKTYQLKKEREERIAIYREQVMRARNIAAANNTRNDLSNNKLEPISE